MVNNGQNFANVVYEPPLCEGGSEALAVIEVINFKLYDDDTYAAFETCSYLLGNRVDKNLTKLYNRNFLVFVLFLMKCDVSEEIFIHSEK